MKFTLAASAFALVSSVYAAVPADANVTPDCLDTIVAKEGDNCRTLASDNKITTKQVYQWNFVHGAKGNCAALVAGEKYCIKASKSSPAKGLTARKLAEEKVAAAKKTTKKHTTKKHTTKKHTTKKHTTKKHTTKKHTTKKVTKKHTTKKASKKVSKKTTKKHTTKKTTKKTTTKKTTTKGTSAAVTQSKPGDNWSSTPKSAPSNAVRHIISSCTGYSTVTAKDSWCGDFSKRNGITAAELYKWNAGLHGPGKHECDNLDDGKAYCVKV